MIIDSLANIITWSLFGLMIAAFLLFVLLAYMAMK